MPRPSASRRARLVLTAALTIAACLSLAHCGGSDGGSRGPTAPTGDFLIVAGGLLTSIDCACIREVELLIDGRVVARSAGADAGALLLPWTVTARADRGQHQLAVRIFRQTASPTTYLAVGGVDVVNSAGGRVLDLDLPDKTETLGTGESISWTFSF